MCHLLHIWLYSWFQTNSHPPDVPPASNILVSLSCSGPKPSNYPEFSLSLTSNIQSINKLGQLYLQDQSWIWPLLPSCPHLSLDYWASILTDLILPAIVFPLTIKVLFGKDQSGDAIVLCLNQPWTIGPHLPFQPWVRASLAHSLHSVTLAGLGIELDSLLSQGFAFTVPLPSTRPLWLLVRVSTQVSLPQSGPLITLSEIVPPSLSIPLSCAYSLPRITNDGHFSKCLLLYLPLDGDCSAEPVCSYAAAPTELRIVPGIWWVFSKYMWSK